jgi:hypothetical protein
MYPLQANANFTRSLVVFPPGASENEGIAGDVGASLGRAIGCCDLLPALESMEQREVFCSTPDSYAGGASGAGAGGAASSPYAGVSLANASALFTVNDMYEDAYGRRDESSLSDDAADGGQGPSSTAENANGGDGGVGHATISMTSTVTNATAGAELDPSSPWLSPSAVSSLHLRAYTESCAAVHSTGGGTGGSSSGGSSGGSRNKCLPSKDHSDDPCAVLAASGGARHLGSQPCSLVAQPLSRGGDSSKWLSCAVDTSYPSSLVCLCLPSTNPLTGPFNRMERAGQGALPCQVNRAH